MVETKRDVCTRRHVAELPADGGAAQEVPETKSKQV